jgi:hypothetical protein
MMRIGTEQPSQGGGQTKSDRAGSVAQRVAQLHALIADVDQRLEEMRSQPLTAAEVEAVRLAVEDSLTLAIQAIRLARQASIEAGAAHHHANEHGSSTPTRASSTRFGGGRETQRPAKLRAVPDPQSGHSPTSH